MNDAFTFLDTSRFFMEQNIAVSLFHRACEWSLRPNAAVSCQPCHYPDRVRPPGQFTATIDQAPDTNLPE